MSTYPSRLVEYAVRQFSSLPGIGKKTALRLVLHLLKQSPSEVRQFAEAFTDLRDNILYCERCCCISDTPLCAICSNASRQQNVICVVRHIGDVIAIENTGQYRGLYHVLGGVISPIDGVGPEDLTISSLIGRIEVEQCEELILALGTTVEGDTTNFFIHRALAGKPLKISVIARGVAIGDEIEYADELTLGRSILNRLDFEQSLKF